MKFKDRLVRCAACGAEFVYTVPEQRQRAAAGLPVDAPAFCRECRGADVRLAEAAEISIDRAATERQSAQPTSSPGTARQDRPARAAGDGGRPRPKGRDQAGGGGAKRGPRRGDRGADGGRRGKPAGRARERQAEVRIRHVGTVKWFDETRGYGFIAQDNGDELFVHSTGVIRKGPPVLEQGQSVEYEVEHTARGLQAVDVVPLN